MNKFFIVIAILSFCFYCAKNSIAGDTVGKSESHIGVSEVETQYHVESENQSVSKVDELLNLMGIDASGMNPGEIFLKGWVTLVLIGTVLGLMGKTVIFLDYDDLGYSFGILAIPIAVTFIISSFPGLGDGIFGAILVFGPVIVCLIAITIKSWSGGVRLLLPVSIITKITWGVLFVFAIWQMLSPSGQNATARRKNRAMAIFFAMVAAPIVVRLVHRKEGKFFSPDMISARGVSGVSGIRRTMQG